MDDAENIELDGAEELELSRCFRLVLFNRSQFDGYGSKDAIVERLKEPTGFHDLRLDYRLKVAYADGERDCIAMRVFSDQFDNVPVGAFPPILIDLREDPNF